MQCDKETVHVIKVTTNKRDYVLCEVRDEAEEIVYVIKVAIKKRYCVLCEVQAEAKDTFNDLYLSVQHHRF
jgi:hypothetical protein